MIFAILVNLALVAAAILLPNEVLMYDSWLLYLAQAAVLMPVVLRRTRFASNVFMPSLFTLTYFLVNLCFGAYVVPREYGYFKNYTDIALAITSYNVIVPYLLLCNFVLFVVTMWTLRDVAAPDAGPVPETDAERDAAAPGWGAQALLLVAFTVFSYFDVYGAFSIQFALLVVHIGLLARQQKPYRIPVYVLYLILEVALNFDNKREIVMVLFVLLFLETYYRRTVLRLTPVHMLAYLGAFAAFMGLVLTASILRGYGGLEPKSVFDAVRVIPEYATQPFFADGLVDNLELNYNYGSAITAINFTLTGKLQYLLGLSFWKVFFLPIPRDLLAWKPESVMQLYTKAYSPAFWLENGSLPVVFSSEMFVNFGFFGLVPFAFTWAALNKLFAGIRRSVPHSFGYHAAIFLCLSILAFARGSGLELYILTFLLAMPVLLVVAAMRPWRAGRAAAAASSPGVLAAGTA